MHLLDCIPENGAINMTRALQKHVARRQDQTFADWFAELRELAGERWADVRGPGADDLRGLGRRCDASAGALHGGAHSPAQDDGGVGGTYDKHDETPRPAGRRRLAKSQRQRINSNGNGAWTFRLAPSEIVKNFCPS